MVRSAGNPRGQEHATQLKEALANTPGTCEVKVVFCQLTCSAAGIKLTWQLWSLAGKRRRGSAGQRMVTLVVLTEQDDDAEQDGHQGARAEARPRR